MWETRETVWKRSVDGSALLSMIHQPFSDGSLFMEDSYSVVQAGSPVMMVMVKGKRDASGSSLLGYVTEARKR